jgi:hypothetical protein
VGADEIVEATRATDDGHGRQLGHHIGGSRVEATTGGDGTVRHQGCHTLLKVVTSEKVR